jgi:hypothetical protein
MSNNLDDDLELVGGTPQDLLQEMVRDLEIMEKELDFLTDIDTTQIARAAERIERKLSSITGIEQPRLWDAAELEGAAPPHFLAKDRLVRAAINLLIGDEGIGKSLFGSWIVAALTTGRALPQFGIPARDPGDVHLVLTEDDWMSVALPRLEVLGADLSHVKVLCVEKDGSGAPMFPRDMHLIRDASPAPLAVYVDAWLDTVPAALSVRDPQQARQALHPWKELATATGAAVILVCHTNRVSSPNARDRYGATGVLRQKARMTLFAQQDDDGALLIGPDKANTAAQIPATKFRIEAVQHFLPTDDHDGCVPRLSYVGESDRTAREHISDRAEGQDDEPGGNPAQRFVRHFLSDRANKEAPAAEVIKAGKAAGFGEQELKDARRRARKPRISSDKSSFGEGWVWAIVEDEDGTPKPQGGEDGTQGGMPPSPPPSPPSPPSNGIPGGLTDRTPGQTPAVQAALAKAIAFVPPKGDGRCDSCGFHVQKQGGHSDACPKREAS